MPMCETSFSPFSLIMYLHFSDPSLKETILVIFAALLCKGGKLLPDHDFHRFGQACRLSIHLKHHEKLLKEFERHSSKQPALHILVVRNLL